jgi:hypothetical protein
MTALTAMDKLLFWLGLRSGAKRRAELGWTSFDLAPKEIDRRLQKLDPSRYERLFAQSTAPERNCT